MALDDRLHKKEIHPSRTDGYVDPLRQGASIIVSSPMLLRGRIDHVQDHPDGELFSKLLFLLSRATHWERHEAIRNTLFRTAAIIPHTLVGMRSHA